MQMRKVPMRMCTGCGQMKPKRELVRVVKSQDGEISLDLTGKKAGRGAYVCIISSACKSPEKHGVWRKHFLAGFPMKFMIKWRRNCRTVNKLASMLSLTKKAGKLISGFDVAKDSVEKKNAGLVLLAKDLSPKSRKEIALVCKRSGAQIKELPLTMDEVWFATGKRAGILAVADEGLAKKLAQLTDDKNKEESAL